MTGLEIHRWLTEVAATAPDISVTLVENQRDTVGDNWRVIVATAEGPATVGNYAIVMALAVRGVTPDADAAWLRTLAAKQAIERAA